MSQNSSFRLQVYVDPLFGSERYISFEPDWITHIEESSKWLIFRPRTPVTILHFKNGQTHTVHGHWAEKIKAAQNVK